MRIHCLTIVLAGCYTASAPEGAATAQGRPEGSVTAAADFCDDDQTKLAAAIADTTHVVESRQFHAALEQIPSLHMNAHGNDITGAAVDVAYSGRGTAQTLAVRYEPVGWWLELWDRGETAITGLMPGNPRYARTRLHHVVLERYTHVPEGRACAINTIAHEWTHAIEDNDSEVFTDDGYRALHSPFVSYSVGAVAQCVYLAKWRSNLDVQACIQYVGTHGFFACTCEQGWVDAFIAGDTSCRATD
jgi:hypothetical protein